MRNSKVFFQMMSVGFLSLALLSACNKADRPQATGGIEPPTEKGQPDPTQDISTMPLEQGLKTKYQRLDYLCDTKLTLTRPLESSKEGSVTQVKSARILVWDLLEDFSESKLIELDLDFENVQTSLELRLQVKLLNEVIVADKENGLSYVLRNSPSLQAKSNYSGIEFRDGKSSSFQKESSYVAYERFPQTLENFSFGPKDNPNWKTTVHIDCTLDSVLHSGYEGEFQVKPL